MTKKRKVNLQMVTQIAETPTLHGEEQVLKEIAQVPSKEDVDKLREKLRKARSGKILRRDRS